jgi:hypothetical protein
MEIRMEKSALNPGNRDQRIFERISCELDVQLKKIRYPDSKTAKALNFSGMGFNIQTNLPLKTGEEIEVQINNSESFNPIHQIAIVQWRQKTSTGEWLIGLKFSTYDLTKFIPLMSHIRHHDSSI